jgi:Rod binding domain-containing protein
MGVPLSLKVTGIPIQRPYATVGSSYLAAEKADPGSRMEKLKKAAQEFEGVLLSTWLEEMQKSSLGSSRAGQEAGGETLRSLGTQAVAQALAQRGGLGIARMIVHHFRCAVGG